MLKRHPFAFKHIFKSSDNLTETLFSRSISSNHGHCKSLTLNNEQQTDTGDSVNKPLFRSARYGLGNIFRSTCVSPFQNLNFNRNVNSLTVASSKHLFCQQCRFMSTPPRETVMNVFDRKAKRIQRNRAALKKDHAVYDYIKDEVGWRIADRICDVKRKFNVAVDLGCGRGHVSKHIMADMVGTLYQCDMAEKVLEQCVPSPEVPTHKIHADEEFLPFEDNSLDLVISSLSLHWVNDLPGTFRQIFKALKNDGALIGAMFAGDTLYELRVSLQLAEIEREGGFSPHISPFTAVSDLGNLLNRSGYSMLTIDIDEIVVNYPSMYEVMQDVKGMGENNCAWSRRNMLHRDTLMAAAAIYKEMYGNEDGSVPATFQILNMIAWKPDPSQQQPAKRGSGSVSIQDLDRLDDIIKEFDQLSTDDKGNKK